MITQLIGEILKTYKIEILCHNNRVYRLIVDAESQESARREVISKAISKNLWVQRVFVKSCMPKEDYDKLQGQIRNSQNRPLNPNQGSEGNHDEGC